jgi:hypothetical protein
MSRLVLRCPLIVLPVCVCVCVCKFEENTDGRLCYGTRSGVVDMRMGVCAMERVVE